MSYFVLKEALEKYYDQLEGIVNDLASKCVGGEEASVNFPAGKVTIKLK